MGDDDIERPDLLGYAAEKLGAAIGVLATNPADVRGRLFAAAEHLVMVPASGLPTRLRQKFEALWEDLTHNPVGRPEYGAAFRRKHLKTLSKFAQRIYSLEGEVAWFQRTHS